MSKVVKVTYNAETLLTEITVNGKPFDTCRINGKEIADWAYPFMMRKVKWNGFYDEMVEALGGENEFDLVFEGSEEDLNELKEAWEDAPVTIISGENVGNTVVIEYDENSLTTDITVNGQPFDTSRINGKEIEDWVYPFMMRKVKWDGIFEELAKVIGSEDYTIQFSGSNSAMKELMEDCPESVEIYNRKVKKTNNSHKITNFANSSTISDSHCYDCNEEIENEPDKDKRVRLWEIAANKGDAIAQNNLGTCYYYGLGVEQDYKKAVEWYRKAAEQGIEAALSNLGECYYNGNGVEQDYEKAVEWYTKAAEQEETEAKFQLANCYSNGIGTNQDYQKAFELYSQVYDEEGTDRFIENLNSAEEDIYSSESSNMKKEYAFNFLMSHSLFDVPTIHFLLGKCFDDGIGTVQNYKEAVNWYTKAAEQDNAKACNNLGNCYLHGNGVKKDRAKAIELFKKAKDLGSEAGKNNYNLQKTKDVAGKLGKGVLGVLGTVGSAYAQSYVQSVLDDDDEY